MHIITPSSMQNSCILGLVGAGQVKEICQKLTSSKGNPEKTQKSKICQQKLQGCHAFTVCLRSNYVHNNRHVSIWKYMKAMIKKDLEHLALSEGLIQNRVQCHKGIGIANPTKWEKA